jgi:hypothetical protein
MKNVLTASLLVALICAPGAFSATDVPAYCESTANADAGTCFASHPKYCESNSNRDAGGLFPGEPRLL